MASVFKRDNKKIVPWFSMVEWHEVYKQIYSNDVIAQRNGYEKLLVWKARCPTLPAGVECTLSLVHVNLQDKEMWPQIVDGRLPLYREHDLRLMYSTSIMRFLNHISTVAQDQFETMYQMAERVQIPDWVVNIRHDLAHGYNLPSLNVLRAATNFTLGWIHEHYWKGEAELTVDYFATEDTRNADRIKEHFQDFIEIWQALKVYHLHGYKHTKAIPDLQLMSRINEVIERLPTKSKSKKKHAAVAREVDTLSTNGVTTKKRADDLDIQPLLVQLSKHLEIFTVKNNAILVKDELLVTIMLECQTFLPDEDLLKSLTLDGDFADNEALPSTLRQLWQMVFTLLQEVDIIPTLVKKLVELANKNEENMHRRKVASMWLKEICRGLGKAKRISASTKKIQDEHKISGVEIKKSFTKNGHGTNIRDQIIAHIEKTQPELKDVLILKTGDLPNIKKLLKLVLLSPNKYTLIFLPSLLDLAEPALQATMKKNILDLVQTYTCSDVEPVRKTEAEPKEEEIYTLEMLRNNSKENNELEANEMEVDDPPIVVEQEARVESPAQQQLFSWIRSETYLEWDICPLGILPWQKSETIGNSNLTCDTVWKPSQLPDTRQTEPVFSVNFHDSLEGDKVKFIRKRQKNNKRANLLKKACKLAIR